MSINVHVDLVRFKLVICDASHICEHTSCEMEVVSWKDLIQHHVHIVQSTEYNYKHDVSSP